MLLLPLVTLYKMFQEKDNMIGKVVLGLLLAGLVFILLEKLEVHLIDKHPSNHFFLNQMDLINKHIFGNILSNPLVIVGFVLILNILLVLFVWCGVQEKAKQIEIGRECDLINECEPISFCPFKGLTSRKKAGLVCPLMKKEKSCDTENSENSEKTERTDELMNKMKETVEGLLDGVDFKSLEGELTKKLGKSEPSGTTEKPKVKVDLKTNLNLDNKVNLNKITELVNDFVIPELLPNILGDNMGDIIGEVIKHTF
jgi:hypothetical protein